MISSKELKAKTDILYSFMVGLKDQSKDLNSALQFIVNENNLTITQAKHIYKIYCKAFKETREYIVNELEETIANESHTN